MSRTTTTTLTLALVLVLGGYLVVAAYAHPVADDLDFAANGRVDFWGSYVQQYRSWNGRYASNALAAANPILLGLGAYRAAAAGMIVSTILVFWFFLHTVAGFRLNRAEIVAGALVVSALCLAAMPSIGEGIYWYTAAVTYHVAALAGLVNITLAIRLAMRPHTAIARAALRVGVLVSLALAVGSNEIMALVVPAVYVVGALAGEHRIGPLARTLRWLAPLALLGAAALLLSPGNAAREAVYPERHQLARSVVMTAVQTLRFLAAWVTYGPLLLASLLFWPAARRISSPMPADRARALLVGSAATLIAIVPLAVFPAYWTMGILGQHRTLNLAWVIFVFAWFVALSMIARDSRWSGVSSRRLHAALAMLFVCGVAFTGNGYKVSVDLATGRLADFDRQMRGRYASLEGCRGLPHCEVSMIAVQPESLFVLDIARDSNDWVNRAYARFFAVPPITGRAVIAAERDQVFR